MKLMLKKIFVVITLIFIFNSCSYDENEIKADFIVDKNRIIALKIANPVVKAGDSITMNMLMGGSTFDQTGELPLSWNAGYVAVSGFYDKQLEVNSEGVRTGWGTELEIPEDMSEFLSSEQLSEYNANGYTDITTTIIVDEMSAEKIFRVVSNDELFAEHEHYNPKVEKIAFIADNGQEGTISFGDVLIFPDDDIPSKIALSATLDDNVKRKDIVPAYHWYASYERRSSSTLSVLDSSAVIKTLLPSVEKTGITEKDIVFNISEGLYTVYFTVRDTRSEKFGQDYFYFYILALDRPGENNPDSDTLLISQE